MTFTQGNDTVFVSSAFVTDGVGVNCNGDMEISCSSPQSAIGCDFPGALKINIYNGAAYVDNVCIAGGGFSLSKSGSCPGLTTLTTADGTPNSSVAILYGLPGSTTKPSGTCAGTTVGLANPTLAAMIGSNAVGVASLSFNAPSGACGRSVQAVDIGSCTPSNVIVL